MLRLGALFEEEVDHVVPSIMDADKKQQKGRCGNGGERRPGVLRGRWRRTGECGIGQRGENDVEAPVFEDGLVGGPGARIRRTNIPDVSQAEYAGEAPLSGRGRDAVPGSREDGIKDESGGEVDEGLHSGAAHRAAPELYNGAGERTVRLGMYAIRVCSFPR